MSTDKKGSALSPKSDRLHRLIYLALLLALAIVLNWFESLLPPVPVPAPFPLKYGLSNIAVMYALFFLGGKETLAIAILKSAFVLLTRGLMLAALSLSGGLLSVLLMWLLSRLFRERASYFVLSISGAVAHNLGQLLMLLLFFNTISVVWIIPVLLVTGIGTGILSASLLRLLIPALRQLPALAIKQDFRD